MPNNDAWIARFKALRAWHKTHGSLPQYNAAGGPEDTLRTWLNRQREAIVVGALDENLVKILRMVPGAVAAPDQAGISSAPAEAAAPPAPAGSPRGMPRLQRLEGFYCEHGRLPKFGAACTEEKSLYRYLNSSVRVRYRRGELPADALKRLGAIPGVLVNIRSRPEVRTPVEPTAAALRLKAVEDRLEDLIAFLTENQRLPAAGNPQPEPRLRAYLYGGLRPAYAAGKLNAETARRLNAALPGCLVPKKHPTARRLAA